jgi:hypothetical protein
MTVFSVIRPKGAPKYGNGAGLLQSHYMRYSQNIFTPIRKVSSGSITPFHSKKVFSRNKHSSPYLFYRHKPCQPVDGLQSRHLRTLPGYPVDFMLKNMALLPIILANYFKESRPVGAAFFDAIFLSL